MPVRSDCKMKSCAMLGGGEEIFLLSKAHPQSFMQQNSSVLHGSRSKLPLLGHRLKYICALKTFLFLKPPGKHVGFYYIFGDIQVLVVGLWCSFPRWMILDPWTPRELHKSGLVHFHVWLCPPESLPENLAQNLFMDQYTLHHYTSKSNIQCVYKPALFYAVGVHWKEMELVKQEASAKRTIVHIHVNETHNILEGRIHYNT